MNNVFRRSIPVLMATVFGTGVIAIAGTAGAQNQGDPPARVGRLAYEEGTVSFHDGQDNNWTAASVNDALTTGDSLWTEPNARGEVSVAGSRVRLDQSTQLDMLKIDDSQTRLQLDKGRLDMDTSQPYEVVTPRGTVKLEAQGDYYVESGTTSDPTRLGVRSGAAQITGANGQVLAVRAGEIGEITGDAQSPQLRTIQSAPPPMPQYWAQRDQQISYDAPQYLSADVVGYEDMQAYGAWSNDPDYGQVWSPNNVPDGWQPYSTGEWAYSDPYGWTWVDEQPWGFAPYHYGRWANRNNRWYWVPPERRDHAVYAPALVAFVGGAALGAAIGNAGAGPVGWFPLGPREAYVPPYSHDRAYYDRLNTNAHVDRAAMDDRWQHAERHEALTANDPNDRMANRRFTTVVPAAAFVGSQKVERSAIKVSADKLASAPVSAVSAPPAPAQGNEPHANTRFEGVQALGRPTPAQHPQGQHAPGPAIAAHAQQPNAAQPNHPAEPNNRPAEATRVEPNRAEPNRAEPARPGEAPRPPEAQAHQAEGPQAAHPGEAPRPAQPAAHQAEHPEAQHQAAEPPRPAETHAAPPLVQHAEPQHVQAPVQHAAPPSQEAHAPAPPPHPAAPAPAPHPAEPSPAPHPAPAAHPEEKK
jgi:hypothetical protein